MKCDCAIEACKHSGAGCKRDAKQVAVVVKHSISICDHCLERLEAWCVLHGAKIERVEPISKP